MQGDEVRCSAPFSRLLREPNGRIRPDDSSDPNVPIPDLVRLERVERVFVVGVTGLGVAPDLFEVFTDFVALHAIPHIAIGEEDTPRPGEDEREQAKHEARVGVCRC